MRVSLGVTPKLPTSSVSTSTSPAVVTTTSSSSNVALQAIQIKENVVKSPNSNMSYSKNVANSAAATSRAAYKVASGTVTSTTTKKGAAQALSKAPSRPLTSLENKEASTVLAYALTHKRKSVATNRRVFNELDIENTDLNLKGTFFQNARDILKDRKNILVLYNKEVKRIFFTDSEINTSDVSCFKNHLVVYCEISPLFSDFLRIRGGLMDLLGEQKFTITLGPEAVEKEYVYRLKDTENVSVFTMYNPSKVSDRISTPQYVQKRIGLRLLG